MGAMVKKMGKYDFIYDYPNPILVFTHGDADGLAAGALLARELKKRGKEFEVIITQPFALHNDLRKYDMSYNYIIVDLGITEKSKKLIIPGSLVIDHHPDTKKYERDLHNSGVFTLINIKKSASQLVYSVVSKSKENGYIAKLGAAGDKIIEDDELGRQASTIAASMGYKPRDDEMRYYILEALIEGKTVWEMERVKVRAQKAFEKLDKISEDYVTLFENDIFIVRFYKEGFGFASKLANKLQKETKKVAFAACYLDPDSPELLVTGRTSNSGSFDLRKIFDKFPRWGGYGGGHRGAASGVMAKEKFVDFCFFLEEISRG